MFSSIFANVLLLVAPSEASCEGLEPSWKRETHAILRSIGAGHLEIVAGTASPVEARIVIVGQQHEVEGDLVENLSPAVVRAHGVTESLATTLHGRGPLERLIEGVEGPGGWDNNVLMDLSEQYPFPSPENLVLGLLRSIHMAELALSRARVTMSRILVTCGPAHASNVDGVVTPLLQQSKIPFIVLIDRDSFPSSDVAETLEIVRRIDQPTFLLRVQRSLLESNDPFVVRPVGVPAP